MDEFQRKSKGYNNGLEIELRMKKWFKGLRHPAEAVDFQTSTTLYEVKSCNFYNRCTNGNRHRIYKVKPHKSITSLQAGRFLIVVENHLRLKELAGMSRKQAKYVFVACIANQIVWKTISWDKVDELIKDIKDSNGDVRVKISDIFKDDK